MTIILGYITLLCFVLMVGKYIARKSKNQKANRFFWKLHKPASGIFFIACIVHLILAVPVFKARSLWVVGSGIIAFAIAVVLITLCHVTKDKKKRMAWHRGLSAVLVVLVVLHVITYFIDFNQYKENIRKIKIEEVEVSKVSDGTYIGEYDAGYIYAKVQVTVNQGRMTEIKVLEHRTERGKKAEQIVGQMVNEQKLDVDAVSSATNSSLVIKKACEAALRKG